MTGQALKRVIGGLLILGGIVAFVLATFRAFVPDETSELEKPRFLVVQIPSSYGGIDTIALPWIRGSPNSSGSFLSRSCCREIKSKV